MNDDVNDDDTLNDDTLNDDTLNDENIEKTIEIDERFKVSWNKLEKGNKLNRILTLILF